MKSTKEVEINICIRCKKEIPKPYDLCETCCLHEFKIWQVNIDKTAMTCEYAYHCHNCGANREIYWNREEIEKCLKDNAPKYTTVVGEKVVK